MTERQSEIYYGTLREYLYVLKEFEESLSDEQKDLRTRKDKLYEILRLIKKEIKLMEQYEKELNYDQNASK